MKNGLKAALTLLFVFIATCSVTGVSAWEPINKSIDITIAEVTEPYWFDLLFVRESAPTLSPEELAETLPNAYESTVYAEALNGYRDEAGYVSYRLYRDNLVNIEDAGQNLFHLSYYQEGTMRFKLALVFADGTMIVSPIMAQAKDHADVTFDLVSLDVVEPEFDNAPPALDSEIMPYPLMITLAIALGLIAIIAAESLVLFLFGYRRKKTFVTIGVFNAAAYAVVCGLFFLGLTMASDPFFFFIFLVIAVLIVLQGLYFALVLPERRTTRAFVYAFFANAITIATAVFVVMIIYYY